MKITIHIQSIPYTVDFAEPIDISLPLSDSDQNPLAWYLEKPRIEPVKTANWVGQVAQGSSTNFNNIFFNPHGHGTHTECLGHITKEFYSINRCLTTFFFMAELISITPSLVDGDALITKIQLVELLKDKKPEALVIRTLPNAVTKKNINYSHTNPPYLTQEAAEFIRELEIKHLLIDLPSVDREVDGGKLLAHKAFWNVTNVELLNADARMDCTITELIFVPDTIIDGAFLLNLQIASFENDASPSKPVLYRLINT
ncbi:MAG: cyclase family protein [Flavobacterium sp.]|nr:cyclase family protein [Flavobacterium sp.]